MLATQMAAPNSPQWFNTGLNYKYDLTGKAQGFWFVDPATGELTPGEDSYSRPQPHACFIPVSYTHLTLPTICSV